MADEEVPAMPQSQAEWAAHWAFYRLTVMQRDQAWREVDRLKQTATSVATTPEVMKMEASVGSRKLKIEQEEQYSLLTREKPQDRWIFRGFTGPALGSLSEAEAHRNWCRREFDPKWHYMIVSRTVVTITSPWAEID